jgi:hypothetical protein
MRTPNGLRIFGAGISSSDKQRPAVGRSHSNSTLVWGAYLVRYARVA